MALGKGLSALLTSTSSGRLKKTYATGAAAQPVDRLWQVPISEIIANRQQPRKEFSEPELRELADSIVKHGILQPLLVAEKDDGNYELIAGERRLRAAKLAGLVTVPAVLKSMADQERLEVALVENIQREDLNTIEEASAYKRLSEEFGLTQQAIAEKVGKSRPAIANTLRLLELPAEVQAALIGKKISAGQARALLGIADKQQQLELLSSMLGQKITVRELEDESRQRSSNDKRRRDPNLIYLENQLRAVLGTKVFISRRGSKGTIAVSFYSTEELVKIVKRITGN